MKRVVLATVAAVALWLPAHAQQAQPSPETGARQDGRSGPMSQSQSQDRMSGQSQAQMPADQASGDRRMISHDDLSEDQVRRLQEALNRQGQSVEVDGKWGPRTQAAVREFNKSHRILEDGSGLNPRTLSALGLDPTTFSGETTGRGGASNDMPAGAAGGYGAGGSGAGVSGPNAGGSGAGSSGAGNPSR